MELVQIKHGHAFCDSSMVAKKFQMKHNDVTRAIERLLKRLREADVTPKVEVIEKEYRGQHYTAYLMDKNFFTLLCMRFETKRALEWQIKFNNAFYEMEQRILADIANKADDKHIEARKQSKIGRKEETDIIKEFVEYATNQGSKSAKFYYKHITTATYKALELMAYKNPKLRDTLDIYQLSELLLAERVAKNSLKRYMDLGRNYKDIYESVKQDLITFGQSLRLE